MRKVDHPTRLFASPQCGTGFWDGISPLYEMQRVDYPIRLLTGWSYSLYGNAES